MKRDGLTSNRQAVVADYSNPSRRVAKYRPPVLIRPTERPIDRENTKVWSF